MVFGSGVETDGFAHVRLLLEELTEGASKDVIDEFLTGQSGKSTETSIDGDVVGAGEETLKVAAKDGSEIVVFKGCRHECEGGGAILSQTEMSNARGDTSDGSQFCLLFLLDTGGSQTSAIQLSSAEVTRAVASSNVLSVDGLHESGIDDT